MRAIRELAHKPLARTLRVLEHCLDDRDDQVRAAAATVLWEYGDSKAIKPLVEAVMQQPEDFREHFEVQTHGTSLRRAPGRHIARN